MPVNEEHVSEISVASVQVCSGAADSGVGHGERMFSGSPAKADQLKILTLIQKADSQFKSERVNLCK